MSGARGRTRRLSSVPPVVRTDAGAVRGAVTRVTVPGRAERTVSVFHGVPYMAPPVGPLRFASPRPHPPWPGIRPADTVRPAFAQASGPAP
ncbi:carboxylesterase family protein, partial [Streptomyces spectabilis]